MIRKLTTYTTKNLLPYRNQAVEEYLTFHTEPEECILYLWQNRKTVVIGKNQNCWKECRVQRLEEDGGYLARRLSGGGAVFHDFGNLNFTFCVRKENYDVGKQLEVILQAVRDMGLPARKSGRNDLIIEGQKFSGNAFYRSGDFCFHHGTLLVDTD
ncbi:MAG TPA: lipoate--protein ligase, partial [Candidatus Choladousia intestinavium]|nr:lipoate--protein ligase [Candidatus Choladousia intestinavium]